MMKYFVLTLLMIATPAFAQQNFEASPSVCGVLNAQPYQANVDAYGRAVAPADLNASSANVVPDVIKVPLTVDLAKRVSGLASNGVQLEAPLGMLEVSKSGSVMYNGQDLTGQMKTLCGIPHVITREVTVTKGDGILNQIKIINDTQMVNEGVQVQPPVVKEVVKQAPARAAVSKLEPEAIVNVEQAPVEVMPAAPAPRVEAVGGVRVKTVNELEKQLSEKIEGGDYRDFNLNE